MPEPFDLNTPVGRRAQAAAHKAAPNSPAHEVFDALQAALAVLQSNDGKVQPALMTFEQAKSYVTDPFIEELKALTRVEVIAELAEAVSERGPGTHPGQSNYAVNQRFAEFIKDQLSALVVPDA